MPGAWRDSAISQLDAIAAANEASVVRARRRKVGWSIAMAGAALWLASGSLSSPVRDATQRLSQSSATTAPPVAARLMARGTVADAPVYRPAVMVEAHPVAATALEAARKPRTAQAAEARRKSAPPAHEPLRAVNEAERLDRAREEAAADRAKALQQEQAARDRAQAAELARQQALLAAQNTQPARLGVSEACSSSGGFLSQQFCHARECRRAEHQDDAVCVRLHEIEVARLQYSADR